MFKTTDRARAARAQLAAVLADLRDADVALTMEASSPAATLLTRALKNRNQREDEVRKLVDERETLFQAAEQRAIAEGRDGTEARLTDEETVRSEQINARVIQLRAEISQIDGEIPALREDLLRDQQAEQTRRELGIITAGQNVRIVSEPTTYRRGGEFSIFRDLYAAKQGGATPALMDRRERHMREMEVQYREAGLELRVAPNRTDGQGGDLIAPLFLVEEFTRPARASAVFAELCRSMELPPNTDSITIPRFTTTTALNSSMFTTGVIADNASPTETDALTSAGVTSFVEVIAGAAPLTFQLRDLSPVAFDELLMQELMLSHAITRDLQYLVGTGVQGTALRGVTNVGGINATTYTDATPTLPELWTKLIKIASDVTTRRGRPCQAFVMHPRRWAWMLAQLDSSNRPFIVASEQGPANSFAGFVNVRVEGPQGSIIGLPVYTDANIPTNLGGGTNEDMILACNFDDLLAMTGEFRIRIFPEKQLRDVYQVYNYNAFLPGRYPESISTLTGTGLSAVLT